MRMSAAILAIIFAAVSSSPANAAWRYERSADKFTDALVSYAHVSVRDAEMLVRYKDDTVEAYLGIQDYIDDESASVRCRVDKGDVDEDVWSISTDGTSVFSPHSVSVARKMASGNRLSIEVTDFQGSPHTFSFSLSGSASAINRVLKDCGVPARDPRSVDSTISRRVADAIDEGPRELVKRLQEALNNDGAGLPETGERTMATYQAASRVYAGYWADCEAGTIRGEICEDWRTERRYNSNYEYTGNIFNVINEALENATKKGDGSPTNDANTGQPPPSAGLRSDGCSGSSSVVCPTHSSD